MNRWNLILLTLSLSLYSIISNAQTNFLDIETSPPDSIIVCGDSAFFSVEITNTHSQQLTNLVFNPKMIPGMLYIAGSVVGMAEQNISTLHEPLFTLSEIDPNQTITLTFFAKAECSIINQIINLGGSSSSGGLATNQTRVDYLNGGVPEHSIEINGSNSYNILYADIFISTITNQVMQTIPGATYTRSISIQNGGLGKVESLTLLIDFETGVAVSGTNIGNFNLLGQLATVTLGPAEFAMFGNGDGYFELDEVLTLVDTVTMLTCVGGETKYTAFWGCNPLDTCQQDNAYANTILIGGQPVIQSDIVTNEPTFFGCADTGIVAVEYNNVGIESSVGGANYYNVMLRYEANQEMVNYVGVNLNGVDLLAANLPTNITVFNNNGNLRERTAILLDNFFTTDPDGVGGLEDLDNDGYYDDMASGETLLVTYQYLLESPLSFENCPIDFQFQFFRESILGYNNCGTAIWGQNFRNATIQGNPNGAALVTGPSDIFANDTITITFENSFIFSESGRFKSQFPSPFISVLKCDSSQVKTYLTLDPGFQVVPGSVMVNGNPTTFTVNGSLITIFGGQLVGREATNHFSLDLTYDCTVPVTVGGILEWQSVLSCDCGDEINLGCQSQFISRHCPGPPCFGTRSFDVTRTTLGWTDATQTALVSPSTPGLALERAYECDTVCAYSTGYVALGTGLSIDNAHVNMWYRAPGFDESFNYGRGEWIIYDASTGTTHRVPTTTPTLTTNGAPSSTHQMTFDATNAIASTVGLLEEGDSLNIKLHIAVNKTNDFPLGAYQFPRFRAQHAHVDTNGDTLTCSSFGAVFTVLKTKTFIENQIGSTNLGDFLPCADHKFKFGSQVIGGLGILDDFPNEFRPVNVWDDTLCYTLPQGMLYVPNSLKFNNGPASTISPTYDPVTRKLTLIGSDLFVNGWPLLDRVDDAMRVIEFSVSRACDVIKGDNIIPSQYGYTSYASAPSSDCYEYNNVNTDWEVIVNKPEIEMDASLTVIEGFERDLEWNIRVCNNGNTQSDYNWIYINDTSGNLTVVDVIDLSNGSISLPFAQVGNYIYVNVGMLMQSSCIDLSISTLNSDCTPGQLNTLEVFSGWSCSPSLIYDPMACHTDTIPLQYISRRANLQTQVTFPPSNLVDICTPFDFKVLLISSLEGNMDDIVHFVELPTGLSIQPGATYEYPLGTTPQPLPLAINQAGVNTPGWDLTAIIPGLANGFVGTRDTLRNKLKLNYSLVASCAFDPYNLIGINSQGNTNCNELVDLTARKKILINGFSRLDTTAVNLSLIDNSSNCVNQVAAVVNVQNQSIANLNPLNKLEVTLPVGMGYVLGSYLPNPIIQPQVGGTTVLIFDYPSILAPGGTASFNFDLELDQTITCGPYSILARSIIRDTAFCAAIGQACEIGATTGADTAAIAVQTNIDPSFTSSILEPCLGDSFTLTGIATCGTHFWDFGDGNTSTAINPTHTYNGIAPGLYTITHIITSPCSVDTSIATINILNQCCQLNLNITTTAINCNGNCDGTATAVVSNGTAPYTYLWGNLSTTPTITNLCAGTYSVTVTDANACTASTTTVITEPTSTMVLVSITNVNSQGGSNGSITANPSGGTSPYTYFWSNGQTTQTISGLSVGIYSVTITDANGCTAIATGVITEPSGCFGFRTQTQGGWGANPNGNNPGVYLHSNFANAFPSGLIVGCTNTLTFTTAQAITDFLPTGSSPSALPTGNITNPTSYNNVFAGQVTALSLSVGFDNYDSNFGTSSSSLKDLIILSGTFTGWTVQQLLDEANQTIGGCASNYSFSALNNAVSLVNQNYVDGNTTGSFLGCPLELILVNLNPNCAGRSTGAIDLTVSGGTAPYTYSWSNGGTTEDLTNILGGVYTVTVTDANGLTGITSATLITPAPITINITTTDVSCNPSSDSTPCVVTAWSNNGHAVWLPNLPNTPDRKFLFENNSGRLYEYPNGTARITGTIVNRSDVNKRWAVDVYFTNGMDWTSWSALGRSYKDQSGVAGQNYLNWTYYIMDATKSNTLTGLGTYSGTVLDLTHKPSNYNFGLQVGLAANDKDADYGFSCWFDYTSANSNLTGHGDFNGDLNCVDTTSCDGTAQVMTTGGTAPYTYTWSNGASSDSLIGLCADTFSVTITDANGCSTDTVIVINSVICCSISMTSTNTSCPESCDGTASVMNATGTAPYTYQWSNGDNSATLSNLCAGTYTVTTTDANGCISIGTVVITSPTPILVNIDTLIDETCVGNDGAVLLNVTGGTAPYSIDLANFTTATTYSNNTGNFTDLNAGQYIVNVIDTNGCTAVCATAFVVNGCLIDSIMRKPTVTNPTLTVNATSAAIQINYQTSEKVVGLSILGAKGNVLLNREHLKGTDTIEIPTNEWTENTYWIILRGENSRLIQTKKLILSK